MGNMSSLFTFLSFSIGRSTLKGKNLLLEEQILSFTSRLLFAAVSWPREACSKSLMLFPFENKTYPYIQDSLPVSTYHIKKNLNVKTLTFC